MSGVTNGAVGSLYFNRRHVACNSGPCRGPARSPQQAHRRPAVPDSDSCEVRFPDGRESVYFYFDDNVGRASITRRMSSEEAERKAKDLARTEQEKLNT